MTERPIKFVGRGDHEAHRRFERFDQPRLEILDEWIRAHDVHPLALYPDRDRIELACDRLGKALRDLDVELVAREVDRP